MARAQIKYVVTDQRTGRVIQNAEVFVYETGTTTPVTDLFAALTGGAAIASASMLSNSQGEVEGYLTTPRNVRLRVTDNSNAAFYAASGQTVSFASFDEDPTPAYEDPDEEETEDAALAGVISGLAAHLADPVDAHDASAVSFTPAAGISASDVQAAIVEDAGDLAAHLADAADAHDASAISYGGTTGIAATDVEGAIDELNAEAARIGDDETVTGTWTFTKGIHPFDARRFGAVGDGVTDDLAALNAAETAAGAAGGGTVFLAAGLSFYISSDWNITTDDVVVSGYGARLVRAQQTLSNDTVIELSNCSNVVIEGLEIQAAAAPAEVNNCYGVSAENVTNLKIRDCRIHTIASTGVVVGGTSTKVEVSGNTIYSTQADGCRITGTASDVTVSNNTIRDTGDDGISVVGAISSGARPKGITITGNVIDDSTLGRGIAVVGGENVTVVGNTVRDTDLSGIWIAEDSSFSTYSARNVTVSGNNLWNTNTTDAASHGGIGVAGGANTSDRQIKNVHIIGNTIVTCNGAAIRLPGSATAAIKDVFITGNYIADVNGSNAQGIRVSNTTNVLINNNMVAGANAQGVYIVSSCAGQIRIHNNLLIDLNRSSTAGVDGIHIEAVATTPTVVDNVVQGTNLDKAVETSSTSETGIRELFSTTTTITGNYTLDRYDQERTLLANSGSAIVVSIPTDASAPLRVGFRMYLYRMNSGGVTVQAVTPGTTSVVSKGSSPSAPTINGQYGRVVIQKTAANQWAVNGDVA